MNIPSTQRKGFIHGLPWRRTISHDKLLSFLRTVKASTRLFNSFSHCPLTQSSTFGALMVGHESHHHVCLVHSPSSCSNHSQLEQPVPNLAQLSWVFIVSQHLCTPGLVNDHYQGDFFFFLSNGDFPFSNVLALSFPPWEERSQHPPLGQQGGLYFTFSSPGWTDPPPSTSPHTSRSPAPTILVASAGLTGLALGAPDWVEHCRWDLTSAKQSKDPFPHRAGCTPARRALGGHGVDSCSPPAAPEAFFSKAAYRVQLHWVIPSQIRILLLPLLNFIRFSPAHFSSLLLQPTNCPPQIMGKVLQSLCYEGEKFHSAVATRTLVCFHAI